MIRAIIIDDEQPVRELLKNVISEYCNDVDIVDTADSVKSGLKAIRNKKPDLILLDINLTDGTGFDMLEQLGEKLPIVVFITAYNEYAVKAFKFSAIDYIMKPINVEEVEAAIEKCKVQMEKENLSEKLKIFLQNMDDNVEEKKIVLKTAESIHIVKVRDIIRCESDHNYTEFYLVQNKKLLVSKTLKEFDELLCGYGFFRAHQSHLINVNYISRFDKADGGELVLVNDHRVPVSLRKREELFKLFEGM